MGNFLALIGFAVANVGVFVYATISAQASFSRLFLLPLLWFPLLYVINTAFSSAFLFGKDGGLGIASLLILNIASYFILLFLTNVFFWKESFSLWQLCGVGLIVGGIVLVIVRP